MELRVAPANSQPGPEALSPAATAPNAADNPEGPEADLASLEPSDEMPAPPMTPGLQPVRPRAEGPAELCPGSQPQKQSHVVSSHHGGSDLSRSNAQLTRMTKRHTQREPHPLAPSHGRFCALQPAFLLSGACPQDSPNGLPAGKQPRTVRTSQHRLPSKPQRKRSHRSVGSTVTSWPALPNILSQSCSARVSPPGGGEAGRKAGPHADLDHTRHSHVRERTQLSSVTETRGRCPTKGSPFPRLSLTLKTLPVVLEDVERAPRLNIRHSLKNVNPVFAEEVGVSGWRAGWMMGGWVDGWVMGGQADVWVARWAAGCMDGQAGTQTMDE